MNLPVLESATRIRSNRTRSLRSEASGVPQVVNLSFSSEKGSEQTRLLRDDGSDQIMRVAACTHGPGKVGDERTKSRIKHKQGGAEKSSFFQAKWPA